MKRKSDEKFLVEVGRRLRDCRRTCGYSLEDIETKGYPSWRHLQRIEAGKNVTLVTLRKVAHLYGVSLAELLAGL